MFQLAVLIPTLLAFSENYWKFPFYPWFDFWHFQRVSLIFSVIFCPAFTVGKHILTSTEDCEDAIDDDKEDVNHENDCDDLEDHDHDDDHHIDDDDNEYCDVDDDLGDNEYCDVDDDVDDDDYPDVDDVEIFGIFQDYRIIFAGP